VTTDHETALRSRGLHVTAQRLAVLRAADKHPHGSAEIIADAVRAEIGTISRQAVYDVLGALTQKGLLRRVQPAGSPALFDPRVGDGHHHAICRSCGAVADVDCDADAATSCIPLPKDCDYRIDDAEILYWGSCPRCRDDAPTPKRRRPTPPR
jgi:Fur family transcriptional regulator, stress-responsive regulator